MPRSLKTPPAKPTAPPKPAPPVVTPFTKRPVTTAGGTRGHMGEKPKQSLREAIGRRLYRNRIFNAE